MTAHYVLWLMNMEGEFSFYKMYHRDLTPDQWKTVTSPLEMKHSLCYFREKQIDDHLIWIYEKLETLLPKFSDIRELEIGSGDGTIVRSQRVYWII